MPTTWTADITDIVKPHYERGLEQGMERGRQEGVKYGLEQGMERGRQEGVEYMVLSVESNKGE